MAANNSGCLGAILSTVFTTVLAPIVVSIVTAEVKSHEDPPAGQGKAPAPLVRKSEAPPAESVQVIAQGVGWSPDEAVQDALRKALWSAAAGHVDPTTWARTGQVLFDALLRNSQGLILRYREACAGQAWHQGREYYHKTLAVDVAPRALADRLRTIAAPIQ